MKGTFIECKKLPNLFKAVLCYATMKMQIYIYLEYKPYIQEFDNTSYCMDSHSSDGCNNVSTKLIREQIVNLKNSGQVFLETVSTSEKADHL